jgi:uncharacterized protein (TIGR02246 family)
MADPFDEAAIREIVAAQAASWNRQDATAWSACFDDDAEFITIAGRLVRGKRDIETSHGAIFASVYRASHVTVTIRRTAFLGPDVALVDTDHALRGYDALPPGISPSDDDGTLRTRMRYVLQRRGRAWLIVAAQNTAIAPAARRS